jgi:LacI family transcriptional regulator
MVCNTGGSSAREVALAEAFLERRVAGLALLQLSDDAAVVDVLRAEGVPAVVVGSTDDALDSVAVDEQRGMARAVEHLAALGHRRLAYVTSDYVEQRTNTARHGGFAAACVASGCDRGELTFLDVDAVLAGAAPTLDGGATGFVAANDLTAIALVEALARRGRSVPRDASVVGFDGIALTALAGIALTTIVQPLRELARIGAELLLERINGADEPPRRVVLEPNLVVRTTTAEAPGRSER